MDQDQIPEIPAKTIVTRMAHPSCWFGIEYNMNIYRGCSHGCIYCDSRSKCYQNYDFEVVKTKRNGVQLLREELCRKTKKGIVATGAMSDPYNPEEQKYKFTREALKVINEYHFGVSIDTKSDLILRDIDLLKEIATHSPVIIKFSITTSDEHLCKIVEPDVSSTAERFDAISKLSAAGIFTGILMNPILPFINDTEDNINGLVTAAKAADVKFMYPEYGMAMTLREGNREYYYSKLDEHFPGVKQKYIAKYGNKYICKSPDSYRLMNIFMNVCRNNKILTDMKDIIKTYKSPYMYEQINFFKI